MAGGYFPLSADIHVGAAPNVGNRPIADIRAAKHIRAMIDFKQVWLPQIVSYARLISSGQLENQWLGLSGITTSVSDPDELHEQIFDDLDAVAIWAVARQGEGMSTSALSAVDAFLTELSSLEGNEPATIVGSSPWAIAKVAAGEVLTNVR